MRRAEEFPFIVRISLTTPHESDGRWDYFVVVRRKSDGATKSDLVSGGHVALDATVERLKRELAEVRP